MIDTRKSHYTPRIASVTFQTAVVKTDEALLLIKCSMANGSDINTANDDMHMIDDMMHMTKMHNAIRGFTSRTRSGNYRKRSTLSDALSDMINARLK